MSSGYYVFWLVQLCIGALVGVSAARQEPMRGFVIALVLGWVAVVELVIVSVQKLGRNDINIIGQIISVLVLGFVVWGLSLLFALIGYWLAFWASGRLGGGGWQFGITTLLAFVAIYAVVAAIGRMM